MKDEGNKTETRKMKDVGSSSPLLKENKETNKQVNEAEEIYVDCTRRPPVYGVKSIQVGVIESCLFGIGRPLHQIVYLSTYLGSIQIHLHIPGAGDHFILTDSIEAYAYKLISRQEPRSLAGGVPVQIPGNDPIFGVNPLDAVRGRSLVFGSLTEIQRAGANQ